MKRELNTGETVKVRQFSFTNTAGGTGMSNWTYNTPFKGVAEVEITESWYDYECGECGIGRAVSPDLIAYLEQNAHATDKRVFVGEFDIIGG